MPTTMSAALYIILFVLAVIVSAILNRRAHESRAKATHKRDSGVFQNEDDKREIFELPAPLSEEVTTGDRGTDAIMRTALSSTYSVELRDTESHPYAAALPSVFSPFAPSELASGQPRKRMRYVSL
jgi:hypothetical protein